MKECSSSELKMGAKGGRTKGVSGVSTRFQRFFRFVLGSYNIFQESFKGFGSDSDGFSELPCNAPETYWLYLKRRESFWDSLKQNVPWNYREPPKLSWNAPQSFLKSLMALVTPLETSWMSSSSEIPLERIQRTQRPRGTIPDRPWKLLKTHVSPWNTSEAP